MNDSESHEPDFRDASSEYATLEEVAAALENLSRSELDRIELKARHSVRGTDISPHELVNTVVERLLTRDGDHGRHWHRKETLTQCFERTMKSIVRDHWRHRQVTMTAVSDGAAGLREFPDSETQLIARQELDAVLTMLSDDGQTSAIALALAKGHTPAEIRKQFGLTETEYDSALRRIRRRILKRKSSGGQE
jgi:DNA-directed RNA polymerase specialized sigma24 family protein